MIDHLSTVGLIMGILLTLFGVIGRAPRPGWMMLGALVVGASFWIMVFA